MTLSLAQRALWWLPTTCNYRQPSCRCQISRLSALLKGLLAFMFSCPQAGCQRVCSHTHVGEVAEVIRSCKPS